MRSALLTGAAIAVLGVASLAACKPAETTAPATPADPATPTAPADPAATTDTSAPLTGPWAGLQNHVDKYPKDSGLLTDSPIVTPLKTLLGDKYDTFVTNMGVQSPLTRDGDLLFTSGNKPHEGGSNAAYLIVDPASSALEAGLWESGKLTTYATPGATLRKPADIETMIRNAAE